MNSSQSTSMDREEKLNQLKNSLAWMCCDELLVPPIPLVEPLRLLNSDTDEIKQEKRNKHTRLIFERDQERKEREPELLSSLDKVVERVVVARPQYKKTIDYATITDQTKTVKLSCPNCKNKEPDDFFPDPKSGDTVCLKCGLVVHALGIDKGAAKRNFEGEEEKNHFGPAPNALMSDAYNMSTRMTVTKNGMNNSNYQKTARVAQQVEMDLSNIGSTERHTREGYKNDRKRHAFEEIENISENLRIHQAVRRRAKAEFAHYRDLRDAVQQHNAVVCACILLAYKETLQAGGAVDVQDAIFRGPRLAVPETIRVPEPKSNDPAEYSHSDAPIARWDTTQACEWLLAVSDGQYDEIAQNLAQSLETQRQKSSQNSRYAGNQSFLGSTTIMGRNKKLSDGNSSNGTSSGISVGQLLVTLKKFPTSLSTTPDIERHFMSAIKRRNDFELRKKSALEEIEKERKRLTQDTGSSISTSKVVMKPLIEHPVNFTNKSVHMETKSNIQPSTNNDFSNGYIDLNSLFGGEVTIKSEIVPSVAVLTRSNIPTKATTSSSNSSIISSKSKVSGGIIEDKPLPISELPKKQAPIEPASVNNVSELTTTVVPVPQQPKKKKLKITFVDE